MLLIGLQCHSAMSKYWGGGQCLNPNRELPPNKLNLIQQHETKHLYFHFKKLTVKAGCSITWHEKGTPLQINSHHTFLYAFSPLHRLTFLQQITQYYPRTLNDLQARLGSTGE